MTLGVVVLVHTAFDRAEQAVRLWADAGCPVVIHVDRRVDAPTCQAFVKALSDLPDVKFVPRFRCEWGTWGLVAAAQAGATLLLDSYPAVRHVYLASGACLPLRPVAELCRYLEAHPGTDFIESATTADVSWTVGGLDMDRFLLRFPFSWRKQRRLFDRYVKLQQFLGVKRTIPAGITPHLGSQWWCLTRQTLVAILSDPQRPEYDRYFRRVWIPDESYFQTLARKHAHRIESRSLTVSKFDFQGKPHIFYDDHFELLARSGCFVVRKVWPQADLLYRSFPRSSGADRLPNTTTIDRVFDQALVRRTRGRHGLFMQSRFPVMDRENGFTATPYSVLQGFDAIIPDFQNWLRKHTGAEVHGHLFARERAHFSTGEAVFRGGLADHPKLRDYNPQMFLTNLIWGGREHDQCFLFGPQDAQDICWMLAKDTNARIMVVTGAWALALFRSGATAADCRTQAAHLQQVEQAFVQILRSPIARAYIRIVSLSDFVRAPCDMLQATVDEIAGHRASDVQVAPPMMDLEGFAGFLQDLKNQGMPPFLTGEFSVGPMPETPPFGKRKQYVRSDK
ncbi:beta-1,6-N-acetylglucosaminyltransferase [Yoonia sp.]|uniref:DUF5927 domain-containing protein n=1 Tax=Yoonia sp. TaxID=2212373 RepID=UPI0019DC151B|nr:beta-1,6-N-acetylglucosaminyltransferase [Yoonia sp.]MBE0413075.1 glycosyl transferase [Yoonia sp.]